MRYTRLTTYLKWNKHNRSEGQGASPASLWNTSVPYTHSYLFLQFSVQDSVHEK